MSSQIKEPEFRSRLARLIDREPPFAWAERMGFSKGGFSRIWNEGTIPSGPYLRLIAEKTGVSIDWLLLGEGPMRRGESVPVDLQTMEEVIKTVEELFQANELYLPPEKKAKLITLIYEDVSQGEIKAENFKSKVIELVRFAS